MCGISAYIGYDNCFDYIIKGIELLLERGYDGVGCTALTKNNELLTCKIVDAENNIDIIAELEKHKSEFESTTIGMAHNRWAVVGNKSSECNVHPHADHTDRFSLVHNGIIENYAELKQELITKYNITFRSETDTEVIVQLISVYYDELKSVEKAIQAALRRLEGTWGLVIISSHEPEKMFCARHGSSLCVGFGENYTMVASQQSGFCRYVKNYICLNDKDLIVLEKKDNKVIFNKISDQEEDNTTKKEASETGCKTDCVDIDKSFKSHYKVRDVTDDGSVIKPDPYNHWTIKEINEQVEASLRAMGMGSRIIDNKTVKLGGLSSYEHELKELNHLILLGCGTSLNSGLYVSQTFKQISGFETVQSFNGSEFSHLDIPKSGKTGLVFISQSGETKDLHNCIQIGKENNLYMIGVINSVDSLIAREVHCGIYLNAGREVGVASTKAFMCQVIVLHLMAVWFAQIRGINEVTRQLIIKGLRNLPINIRQTIQNVKSKCKEIAKYLATQNSLFVLGKGCTEFIAKEGSLKIKEIGYIHAEAYSSSELKHGPLSLIQPGLPIILIAPNDDSFARNQNIANEVKSRDGYVIGISDKNLDTELYDVTIKIPSNEYMKDLLAIIPLQIIAYKLSLCKGINPDKPRNLCKTVTVL